MSDLTRRLRLNSQDNPALGDDRLLYAEAAYEIEALATELTTCQEKAKAFDNIMKSTYLRQAILNSYKGDVTLGKDIPAIIKRMLEETK